MCDIADVVGALVCLAAKVLLLFLVFGCLHCFLLTTGNAPMLLGVVLAAACIKHGWLCIPLNVQAEWMRYEALSSGVGGVGTLDRSL